MKIYFLSIFAIVMLFSCSQETSFDVIHQNDRSMNLSKRTPEEVMHIAEMISNSGNTGLATKSAVDKYAVRVYPILYGGTRNVDDTVIYAVDYQNNGGFALISANKIVEPVLAVVENGSFEDFENSSNASYQYVLNQAIAYSRPNPIGNNGDGPLKPIPIPRDTVITETRHYPLVSVAWNQKWPEGMYCPNYIAGCGPIAVAHLCSAYELPQKIAYSYEGRDNDGELIDWKMIKKHKKSEGSSVLANDANYSNDHIVTHLENCNLSLIGHRTIGRFVRQIGELSKANYRTSGTSTYLSELKSSINFLTGKDPISYSYSASELFNSLKENPKRLALMTGAGLTADGSEIAGHAWIADGIWQVKMVISELMPAPNGSVDSTPTLIQKTYTTDYIHYNWGWGGNCNGYFLTKILDPNRGSSYDYKGEQNEAGINSIEKYFECLVYTAE